ncbi:MAG: putative hydrolase, partial [Gemmatimonadetes bacterium]|nr:putative hydrolase [Gemmatimonadota bacterium]
MKRLTVLGAVLAGIILVLGGSYLTRNPEHATLDAGVREAAGGQFVTLSDGVTHYDISGPADGAPVALVHGFSVPGYIWDSTVAALTGAGYRVLRYDLFGRGFSDRPDVSYDADLYDRQLGELLDSTGFRGRVHVMGLSFGGFVTGTFAGRHLEPARWPDWVGRYRVQMQYRGFGRALRSTRMQAATVKLDSLYATVGRQTFPVQLIWGVEDQTVPIGLSERVRQAIPRIAYHPIERAGHLPHMERTDAVNPILVGFLRSADAAASGAGGAPPSGSTAATAPKADAPPRTIAELESRIREVLERRHLPAVGIAIVSRDSVVWTAGIGRRDVAGGWVADANPLFRLGSTSKAFTSLLVLLLPQDHRLDLQDPISKYIPEIG